MGRHITNQKKSRSSLKAQLFSCFLTKHTLLLAMFAHVAPNITRQCNTAAINPFLYQPYRQMIAIPPPYTIHSIQRDDRICKWSIPCIVVCLSNLELLFAMLTHIHIHTHRDTQLLNQQYYCCTMYKVYRLVVCGALYILYKSLVVVFWALQGQTVSRNRAAQIKSVGWDNMRMWVSVQTNILYITSGGEQGDQTTRPAVSRLLIFKFNQIIIIINAHMKMPTSTMYSLERTPNCTTVVHCTVRLGCIAAAAAWHPHAGRPWPGKTKRGAYLMALTFITLSSMCVPVLAVCIS